MATPSPSNLTVYIPAADTLLDLIGHIVLPTAHEIQAALRVLAHSPVSGYPPFAEAEIRLIGAYRAFISQTGGYESVWSSIVAGD